MRSFLARLGVLALATLLAGCAANSAQPAGRPSPPAPEIPVPILHVGESFAADLFGDGQATITIATTQLSERTVPGEATSAGNVRLVVTVDIVLNKAGNPITGGPENFVFLDSSNVLHPSRVSQQVFPPALARVNLSTTGQHAGGKLFFDVPAGSVAGGHVQLVTGRLVHAVWQI
jgi:hypothetical protein